MPQCGLQRGGWRALHREWRRRRFNPEKFQVAHSHQGAMEATRGIWRWVLPKGKQTVADVVTRIREYASESETEEHLCNASPWKTADGVQFLADSRCTAVGSEFHQALAEDSVDGGIFLCSKHATHYLTKRYPSKCGNVDCPCWNPAPLWCAYVQSPSVRSG